MKILFLTLSIYIAAALLLFAALPSNAQYNISDIDVYASAINQLSQRIEIMSSYRDVRELRALCNKAYLLMHLQLKTESLYILAYLEEKLTALETGKIHL